MATILQSNSRYNGDVSHLPSINAPLPAGAALYADFANSMFVIQLASGQVARSSDLTSILSFNRSSAATRIGKTGLIEYLTANQPAIDYHPMTGVCLGLRAEYAATNRLAYSQNFSNAAGWTPTGIALTADDVIAPDGNLTATKIIEASDSTVSPRTLLANTTMVAAKDQPYTFSVWAKANTGKVLQIAAQGAVASTQYTNFDLANGKIGKTTSQILQVSMEQYPNGWYRCAITITPTGAVSPQFTLALVNSDSGAGALPSYQPSTVGSVWIWGAQAERRDGASSYIPTSGAEAQRADDICTTSGTADFISSSNGTVLLTCVTSHSLQSISGQYNALSCALVIDNAVEGAHLRLAYRLTTNNSGQAQFASVPDASGVSQSLEIPSMAPVRDSEQSAIFSYESAQLRLRLFDGFNWFGRTITGMPPTLSRLCFGRSYLGPNNWFNGHIKKVVYWPQTLSEKDMEKSIGYLS
ncbi:hypothetical protein C9411_20995 [Serratia sp. Nf2]|nr:hypothetical protein C9411_20995 [Serratia sp. Nf2]